MRTNIDIDDAVLDAAMKGGAFKTKKDAVEAGLRLLARQAAYREILRWEGKLQWDGDAPDDAPVPLSAATRYRTEDGDGGPPLQVQESSPPAPRPRRQSKG